MSVDDFVVAGIPIDGLGFEGPLQEVELMPGSLRQAGLVERLGFEDIGDLGVRIRDSRRDPATGVIGIEDCKAATSGIRDATARILAGGRRPVFIGGCCSMAVGIMAGMRDHYGTAGVVYVDGHLDLYDGETSQEGEMADMPMAIVLGHGPADAMRPAIGDNPVTPGNAVIVGYRDREEADAAGSLMPEDIGPDLRHYDVEAVRASGPGRMGAEIAADLEARGMPYYIHLDIDVLDEALFPEALYYVPKGVKGMNWEELYALLKPLVASPFLKAMSIGCYNPNQDPDGTLAADIVRNIGEVFRSEGA